jgi:hypothetical protein
MKSIMFSGLALVCARVATGQQTPKTVTVCELLQDPTKYNGKTIALRGEYSVGGHGLYLRGPDCDGLLITRGYRWPSSIWISLTREEYQQRSMRFEHLLDVQVEVGAVRERERQRRGKGATSEKVTVTFVGLFETREDLDSLVFRRPDGSLVGIGFRQVPGAPGQLFIDSVKDIVVEFGQGATPK